MLISNSPPCMDCGSLLVMTPGGWCCFACSPGYKPADVPDPFDVTACAICDAPATMYERRYRDSPTGGRWWHEAGSNETKHWVPCGNQGNNNGRSE